ncbi:MAG: S1 family peptidase [Propionibacteriaceae bacterium]|nr:S1 family peptidase [Propionibacteriaceae bacterium]
MGSACSTIQSVTYTLTWENACPGTTCNATFISTSLPTWPGDSGGPVWLSPNSLVGIHKGGTSGDPDSTGARSVYSNLIYRPSGTNTR